jgi:hypothetical protein
VALYFPGVARRWGKSKCRLSLYQTAAKSQPPAQSRRQRVFAAWINKRLRSLFKMPDLPFAFMRNITPSCCRN